jgi:hypothetical protein
MTQAVDDFFDRFFGRPGDGFLVDLPISHPSPWSELYHWCKDNCSGEFNAFPKYGLVRGVAFKNQSDAVMFTLRWL